MSSPSAAPLRHIDVLREPKLVIKYGRRYK
jgi:hypothetical protein